MGGTEWVGMEEKEGGMKRKGMSCREESEGETKSEDREGRDGERYG